MTTFTIYANTNDHYILCTAATYALARAGTGTKTDDAAGTALLVGQGEDAGTYYVRQFFLSFDTTSVPSGALDSATLSLYSDPITNTKQVDISEYAWSGGSGDFVAGASLSGLASFGNAALTSGMGAGYKDITGPTTITRTSAYNLIGYFDDQLTNTAPATSTFEFHTFYSSNYTGTTRDPKLTIVLYYKVAAATGSFALTGMAAALTKGKNLAAAAGSFILTGIAAIMGVKRYPPPERIINFPRSTVEDDRTLEL